MAPFKSTHGKGGISPATRDESTTSAGVANASKISSSPNHSPTLLTLPVEIRLQIYEWAFQSTRKEIDIDGAPRYNRLSPQLLRTCRAIRREATPVLYEANAFRIPDPRRAMAWIRAIGQINICYITRLRVMLSTRTWYNSSMRLNWLKVLRILARYATELRQMAVFFDLGMRQYNKNHNAKLVQALGDFRSLKILELGGDYSPDWPVYLRKKSEAVVVAA